ncbi:uncharacterized protein LOC123529352 [Mercenaria mercenaria]|uniref:uncharacterized protein LOC123529352 n=1 Tax=Mercenaria mercenaria TaxID=6596 RepID=UPI00234F1702|nr:uncharacterized protein LOC123529352 [Mercenaria mercenaria]
MAEGSIKDGSDADSDIACTPCGEANIREEAVKYCLDCQQYMCTTCSTYHGRQKATRFHKLLDRDTAKPVSAKCLYHPNRDIEMYCGTHDMVYCSKCIATKHRACCGVTDIDEIKTGSVPHKEIRRIQNDTRNIKQRLADTDKKTQQRIECLENQKDEIPAEIEEVEQSLIEQIRKLKREAMDTLNMEYILVKDELKSNVNLIADLKKEIEKASSQLQTLASMSARQQFVQMKLIQKAINDAENLFANSEDKGRFALYFAENSDLKTAVMTATSIGHVSNVTENKQTVPRLFKVKSKKEINVRMQNDKEGCHITDICQLQDGTIILADWGNRKIKRLDMDYSVKDHLDLGHRLSGICCTGQNEVAVKMHNDKVQFISVGSSLSKLREICVEGGGWLGIAYDTGELWISTGSDRGVKVYSTSGALLKTMNGRNIFKSCTEHLAVCGETVTVTDYSNGAVCLGRDGTVKRQMRDGRLANTEGVCVSGDGTIFLSGRNSNNILMFDKDGKCLGELVANDPGLVNPVALHYDEKSDCIIVTSDFSDRITILDISD